MEINIKTIRGQTPLSSDDISELKIKTISTAGEIDEAEWLNIQKAIIWTKMHTFSCKKILKLDFIILVHKKMFSDVWGWAGEIRSTETNIGIDPYYIYTELNKLFEDCKYWMEEKTFPDDEICIRFKHRLVKIHPFRNGNGRHARLCADILSEHCFNNNSFSWGGVSLSAEGTVRNKYLDALRLADENPDNISPLLEFARSEN